MMQISLGDGDKNSICFVGVSAIIKCFYMHWQKLNTGTLPPTQ